MKGDSSKRMLTDATLVAVAFFVCGFPFVKTPPWKHDLIVPITLRNLPIHQLNRLPMTMAVWSERIQKHPLSPLEIRELAIAARQFSKQQMMRQLDHPAEFVQRNLVQVLLTSHHEFKASPQSVASKTTLEWRQIYWACLLHQQPIQQVFAQAKRSHQLIPLLMATKLLTGQQLPNRLSDFVVEILQDQASSDSLLISAVNANISSRPEVRHHVRAITELVFQHRCNDATISRLAKLGANFVAKEHQGRLAAELLSYLATRDFSQPVSATENAAEDLLQQLAANLPERQRQRLLTRLQQIRRPTTDSR